MPTPVQEDVQVGAIDSGSSWNLDAQLNCAGSDRLVVVEVGVVQDVTVTVTCGGVNVPLYDVSAASGSYEIHIFKLVAPTSGLNTVTISKDDGAEGAARARAFSGVDQTTPLGTCAKQTSTTASPSISVSSVADDFVCDALAYPTSGQTPSVGAGQTADTFTVNPGFSVRLRGSHETATGSSTTMSWTMTSSGECIHIGYAVKGAAAPGVHTKTGTGYLGFVGTGSDEIPRFGSGQGKAGFTGSGARLSVYGEAGTGRMGMAAYGAKGGLTHTKQNASSASLKLAWDASTSPNVLGYRVYWGTSQGLWPNMVDVGLVLTYILQGLPRGTIWLVVTAYNASGESQPSNEISAATAYGIVMTASARRQRDYIRQETARLGFTASGVVVKPEKAGTGQLGFTASGADVATYAETGSGIAGFYGSGADVMTYVETGYAAAGFKASGVGELSGVPDAFLKTGGGSLGFAAMGDWQAIWTEAGAGKLGFAATGTRSVISIPTTVGTAKKRKRSEGRSRILSLTEDR